MIRSFGDDDTRRIFDGETPKRYPIGIIRPAFRKLVALSAAVDIADMAVPPANRLEKLKGKHDDLWSIRINQQWRIIFRWNAEIAYDVTIIDYHSGKGKL